MKHWSPFNSYITVYKQGDCSSLGQTFQWDQGCTSYLKVVVKRCGGGGGGGGGRHFNTVNLTEERNQSTCTKLEIFVEIKWKKKSQVRSRSRCFYDTTLIILGLDDLFFFFWEEIMCERAVYDSSRANRLSPEITAHSGLGLWTNLQSTNQQTARATSDRPN